MMAHEPVGHTLQPTALVHEAFLRLMGGQEIEWQNRAHFFAAAARAMRRILIERARRIAGPKRGGGWKRHAVENVDCPIDWDPAAVLAIHEALDRLAGEHARTAEVFLLRVFAGLSDREAADILELSPRTVQREYRFARAWLHLELGRGDRSGTA
jgi:RNA polymerase sigma factor (TIGR02999 family)